MTRLFCVLFILPLSISAQTTRAIDKEQRNEKGIIWTTDLTWEQVKIKAKADNKYIFVDAFATWCGPCKQMDKSVYTNDTIGNYFNDKFISVKVQCDQTENDNENVKEWYRDAEDIQKTFKIRYFPTYIFLSPDGIWTHMETGFKPVGDFLQTARTAIQPGMVYRDPDEDYYKLVDDYKAGRKDYSKMPFMRKKALLLGNSALSKSLSKDYKQYLSGLGEESLYTKENIEFLASTYIASKSPFFKLFYPDGRKVNALMHKKDCAEKVVDNTIKVEIVLPFFDSYGLKPGNLSLLFSDENQVVELDQADTGEADWEKLARLIRLQYNEKYTDRNLIDAKVIWYQTKTNFHAFAKNYLLRLDKYGGVDSTDKRSLYSDGMVNLNSYLMFQNITDKTILTSAAKWMKVVVKRNPDIHLYMDTYASLLYKLGRKDQGLKWEEVAYQMAIKMNDDGWMKKYPKIIDKMKKGVPTWTVPASTNNK